MRDRSCDRERDGGEEQPDKGRGSGKRSRCKQRWRDEPSESNVRRATAERPYKADALIYVCNGLCESVGTRISRRSRESGIRESIKRIALTAQLQHMHRLAMPVYVLAAAEVRLGGLRPEPPVARLRHAVRPLLLRDSISPSQNALAPFLRCGMGMDRSSAFKSSRQLTA